jgi:hypothetical protein
MSEPRVSVVAVGYHSKEWEDLLRRSVEKFTAGTHEVIVVDNDASNIGHGSGLDMAIQRAAGTYIAVMDIDAHMILQGWDNRMVAALSVFGDGMLAAEGGGIKPIRPCLEFFKKAWFFRYGHSFRAKEIDGLKLDVGIFMYLKALQDGHRVELMKYAKTGYSGVWGEEYTLGGVPVAYHNWYGTRFWPDKKEVDGRKVEDYLTAKESLMRQVKERGI